MKKQPANKTIGIGIAALAAAAAGAYYLYGSSEGKAHRRKVSSWMLKAKAEVMEEIERMKEVNEGAYKDIITKVAKKYKDVKGMDREELAALVMRLNGHWKDIRAEMEKAGASTKRAAPSRKASKKRK